MSSVPSQHLSRPSKATWRSVVADYALAEEPHSVRVLTMALEAFDRAEEARVRIAQDGAYLGAMDRYGHLMPGNEAEAAELLDSYLARSVLKGSSQ